MTATDGVPKTPRTAMAAALTALLALYAAHALYYWTLTDDAYVYFRYAENWAHGHGPVFNVGERVEGYAGILWLALLTTLRLLGVKPEAAAPAIGALCGAVTLALTFAIGRRAAPERHWAWSLIAPFLLAANRTFVAWSTGGLETALFTLLTTAAFARLFVERGESARPWSAPLFALAALTRPEGMLFLAVGAAVRAATSRRRFAQWLVLALGPVAAHEAFRLAYYHAPLPNTFYAKVPGTRWDLGAAYLAAFLLEYAGFWLLPLAVLSWGAPAWRAERTRGGLLWAGAALYLLYVAAIGGDHFEFRFMHVLLPAICLAAQEGVFVAADKLGRTPCRRAGWGRALTLLTAAAAALLPATVSRDWDEYPVMLRPSALAALPAVGRLPGFHAWFTAYDRAYERAILSAAAVRVEEGRLFWRKQLRDGAALRAALAAGLVHRDETISLGCIGVIPYYSGLKAIDELGLVDAAIARQAVTERGRLGHERQAPWSYLVARGVDYVAPTGCEFFLDHDLFYAFVAKTKRSLYFAPFGGRVFAFYSTVDEARLADRFARRGARLFVAVQGQVRSLHTKAPE